MLTILWGIEKYHTHLYCRDSIVITYHKPLEATATQSATKTPGNALPHPRIRVHNPISSRQRNGCMSRLLNPGNASEVLQDVRVDGSCVMDTENDDGYLNLHFFHFPSGKQETLRKKTTSDPVLQSLMDVIRQGWPDTIRELPSDLRSYWSICAELAIESGVICKGNRIRIPKPLQDDVLQQLHDGHQEIEKHAS